MPPALRAFFISEILFADIYVAASKAYEPTRYDGRTVLILAEHEGSLDPEVIWRTLIPNELTIHAVPGDHSGILQEPHVVALASHLTKSLQDAREESVTLTSYSRR